jgi:hypothetical protein
MVSIKQSSNNSRIAKVQYSVALRGWQAWSQNFFASMSNTMRPEPEKPDLGSTYFEGHILLAAHPMLSQR